MDALDEFLLSETWPQLIFSSVQPNAQPRAISTLKISSITSNGREEPGKQAESTENDVEPVDFSMVSGLSIPQGALLSRASSSSSGKSVNSVSEPKNLKERMEIDAKPVDFSMVFGFCMPQGDSAKRSSSNFSDNGSKSSPEVENSKKIAETDPKPTDLSLFSGSGIPHDDPQSKASSFFYGNGVGSASESENLEIGAESVNFSPVSGLDVLEDTLISRASSISSGKVLKSVLELENSKKIVEIDANPVDSSLFFGLGVSQDALLPGASSNASGKASILAELNPRQCEFAVRNDWNVNSKELVVMNELQEAFVRKENGDVNESGQEFVLRDGFIVNESGRELVVEDGSITKREEDDEKSGREYAVSNDQDVNKSGLKSVVTNDRNVKRKEIVVRDGFDKERANKNGRESAMMNDVKNDADVKEGQDFVVKDETDVVIGNVEGIVLKDNETDEMLDNFDDRNEMDSNLIDGVILPLSPFVDVDVICQSAPPPPPPCAPPPPYTPPISKKHQQTRLPSYLVDWPSSPQQPSVEQIPSLPPPSGLLGDNSGDDDDDPPPPNLPSVPISPATAAAIAATTAAEKHKAHLAALSRLRRMAEEESISRTRREETFVKTARQLSMAKECARRRTFTPQTHESRIPVPENEQIAKVLSVFPFNDGWKSVFLAFGAGDREDPSPRCIRADEEIASFLTLQDVDLKSFSPRDEEEIKFILQKRDKLVREYLEMVLEGCKPSARLRHTLSWPPEQYDDDPTTRVSNFSLGRVAKCAPIVFESVLAKVMDDFSVRRRGESLRQADWRRLLNTAKHEMESFTGIMMNCLAIRYPFLFPSQELVVFECVQRSLATIYVRALPMFYSQVFGVVDEVCLNKCVEFAKLGKRLHELAVEEFGGSRRNGFRVARLQEEEDLIIGAFVSALDSNVGRGSSSESADIGSLIPSERIKRLVQATKLLGDHNVGGDELLPMFIAALVLAMGRSSGGFTISSTANLLDDFALPARLKSGERDYVCSLLLTAIEVLSGGTAETTDEL